MEYDLGRKIGHKIRKVGTSCALLSLGVLAAGPLDGAYVLGRAAFSENYAKQLQTESSPVEGRATRDFFLFFSGLAGITGSAGLAGVGSLLEEISKED